MNTKEKGILANDCKIDRLNILISDQYYLENDLLYRISMPRSKKVSRVQPLTQRLCIPKIHRLQFLRKYHDELGHFANLLLLVCVSFTIIGQPRNSVLIRRV